MLWETKTPILHHTKSSASGSKSIQVAWWLCKKIKETQKKKDTFGGWFILFRALPLRTLFLAVFVCGLATPNFTTSAQDFATRRKQERTILTLSCVNGSSQLFLYDSNIFSAVWQRKVVVII